MLGLLIAHGGAMAAVALFVFAFGALLLWVSWQARRWPNDDVRASFFGARCEVVRSGGAREDDKDDS